MLTSFQCYREDVFQPLTVVNFSLMITVVISPLLYLLFLQPAQIQKGLESVAFDLDALIKVMSLSLLAYVLTLIGYYAEAFIKLGKRAAYLLPNRFSLEKALFKPDSRLGILTFFCIIASAMLTVITSVKLDMTVPSLQKNISGYDQMLEILRQFSIFLLALQLMKEYNNEKKFKALTVCIFFIALLLIGFVTKSKGLMVMPFLVLLLIPYYAGEKEFNIKFIAKCFGVLMILIVLIYPAVNFLRRSARSQDMLIPSSEKIIRTSYELFNRLSYLDELYITFARPENAERFRANALTMGEQFVWFLTPRLIALDKPILTQGHLVGHYIFGYDLSGKFTSNAVVFYIGNCLLYHGFTGLFIMPVIFGFLFRFIYNFFILEQNLVLQTFYITSIKNIFALIEGATFLGILSMGRTFIVFFSAILVIGYLMGFGKLRYSPQRLTDT